MNNVVRNPDYRIERLNDENLARVEELYTSVYKRVTPPDFFRNKYNTNFTPVNHIGFIAYNNQGTPIAFYAVIPCFMKVDGQTTFAAQSADTMTHPGYRNKGWFVELALLTYQLCRDIGIKLLFGFPNQNSLPGFISKLGWKKADTMACFIISGSHISWERIFSKLLLKSWYTKYQQAVLKKYLIPQQGICNSVLADGYDGIYRDAGYLNYKTYTNNYVVKIGNSALWIKISDILLIGDISVTPPEYDALMDKLIKLVRKLGIKEIHFHSSPGTTLHRLFKEKFAAIHSFPVIFKQFNGDAPLAKIKFTSADIDTF